MNSSVSAHKVKNSAKSQGKLSSSTSGSKQIATTDLTTASRSSHYATGVVPGFAAPVQAQAVQLQVEPEQENENEDSSLQMMCSECAAEQEESESDSAAAVQMWSCGDYPEPTCAIQSKEEPEKDGEPIQESKAPTTLPTDNEQEAQTAQTPVQQKCAACDAEEQQENQDSPQAAVQMWSCGDYPEPTCAIQNKEEETTEQEDAETATETAAPIQNKCAACDAEQTYEHNEIQQKDDRTPSTKPAPVSRRKASILNQASEGLKNAHGSLPYQERIQTAFGHHDISEVRTEVGGSAARASERMGAQAYASGNRIGFRRTPSLHLAAHEAAHTVQQRAGLKLPGNMGTPGDPWERHADRVADAVVAGESAEALLDTVAPSPARPKAHNNLGAAKGKAVPANGNGIAPQVQGRITSGSTHLIEPELAEEEAATGGGAGAEATEGGGSGAEASAEPEAVDEAAEAAEANDSDPAADCALAEGGDGAEAEPEAARSDAGGEAGGGEAETAPGGASQKGRCYSATAEDPPEGSQEPANDSPPNESEAEAAVTYGAWEEADDACECAAADAMAQETGGEAGESVLSSELPEAGASATLMSGGGEAGAEGEVASGETVAASEGGASETSGGGAGGSAEAAPTDFSQNEATRDTAVAELDTATAEVAGVPGRALNLSRGLNFRGAAPGNAAQEAARAMALSQIRSFMLNATNQIEGATSFVSTEVPTRLGGMADSIIASIDSSMAEQKSAISARIAGARIAAAGEAASAREAIQQEYATNVELVNAETDAAIEYLNSIYASSTSELVLAEDGALSEVNQRFADGRTQHEEAGQEYANRAIAAGQDWVASFDHCRSGPGNDNEYNGDDGFWDGCLTVRRAQAQQKAACSTASGFAKNMIDMGKKKGFELRGQRTQYRCMLIAGAGQAQSTLDTTVEQLVSGLESGRGGTLSGLAQVRDMNLSAVDAALTGTLSSLNRQEREQRQAVNDSGYIQQLAVEELAHQVAAGLARSVSSAMETLEQTLQQLREQLLEGDAPSPDVLQQTLASAEAGLSEGIGTLLDKMEEGAANAESQLIEAGANAASSLAEIASGNDSMTADAESNFSGQMSTLVGAATDAMSQLSERQVTRAQESATQGGETMEQVVSGFTSTCEQVYTSVDGVITTSLSELDTELKNMEDGLDAKIAAEAWRAASKEQPAWKGVLAIVLIVLVIIASIVVTVLTLGAGAPLLAVVLVGAVVGAVTAGLIQIINNWAAGEEWDKGLVQAMVIGAVGGALGGAIGAGANGIAQAAVQGALRAGSSVFVQRAISVGINLAGDMLAEGGTQLFGYVAFGQRLNWQGFLMAGGMSVASTARGGFNSAGSPRAGGGAPTPRADVPTSSGGAGASVRGAMADLGVGMGLAGGVELVDVLTGGSFDANRFFSSAASGAAGSRAAAHGNGGRAPESPTPGSPRARTDGIGSRIADSSLGRAAGSARRRLAGMRDAAFARMEIPETSAASRRWESTTRSVEDWFAGGAGGMLGRSQGADSLPRSRDTEPETTGSRRSDSEESEGRSRTQGEDIEDTASRPRTESEESSTPRQPSEAEMEAPINTKSSAEIEEMTRTPSKIGDADHETYVRKQSNTDIECDICSRACGPIKNKINDIENEIARKTTPDASDADLIRGLQDIKQKIKAAEDSIEGRLVEGEFMAGRSVIELAGKIADGFRSLGQKHKILGEAINDPTVVRGDRNAIALSGRGNADIDVSALKLSNKLELSQSRRYSMDEVDLVAKTLADDQQCIYILRGPEPDRVILKVGKSQQSNVADRFGKYRRAGQDLGMEITLEVTPLRPGMTETDASGVESALRAGLEHEGNIMPWDNTPGGFGDGHQHTGRLNRPGTGVPFEPIRGPSYKSPTTGKRLRGEAETEWTPNASVIARTGVSQSSSTLPPAKLSATELENLLRQNGNDVSRLRDDLAQNHGVDRSISTIYRWLREAGISTSE